jgi:hypothetical protein
LRQLPESVNPREWTRPGPGYVELNTAPKLIVGLWDMGHEIVPGAARRPRARPPRKPCSQHSIVKLLVICAVGSGFLAV